MRASRKRTCRTKTTDAIRTVHLLVNPEQHAGEDTVGDHLVGVLVCKILNRKRARLRIWSWPRWRWTRGLANTAADNSYWSGGSRGNCGFRRSPYRRARKAQ